LKERVGDRQDNRPDEESDDPEAMRPPITPENISSSGRSAPFLIRIGG